MKLLAQLFGIGAMIFLFLIYQQRNRRRIIACKLCADIFWVIHYLMLGGIAGMIPNGVGIFRELIFINRRERKWAGYSFWPVLFIAVNLALGIRTFNSPVNILPIAASAFVTISLWIDNPRLTKIISVPVSCVFIIYDFSVGSYVGIINESVAIISILIAFIKEWKSNAEADFKN